MLTVQGHKQDVVEGLASGANDYVTKPYDTAELLARVNTLVRTRQLYERARCAEMACDVEGSTSSKASAGSRCSPPPAWSSTGPGARPSAATPSSGSWCRRSPDIVGVYLGQRSDAVELVAGFTGEPPRPDLLRDLARAAPLVLDVPGEDRSIPAVLVPDVTTAAAAAGQVAHLAALAARVTSLIVAPLSVQSRARGHARARRRGAALRRGRPLARGGARAPHRRGNRQRAALRDRPSSSAPGSRRPTAPRTSSSPTLSHELRTPLNAILGWAQMLARRAGSTADEHARAVETIERNARSPGAAHRGPARHQPHHLRQAPARRAARVESGRASSRPALDDGPPGGRRQGRPAPVGASTPTRAGLRRPRAPPADRLEPPHQRDQVHAQGRPGRGAARSASSRARRDRA